MKEISKKRKIRGIIAISLVVVLSFGFVSLKDKEFEIVKSLDDILFPF